MDRREKGKTEPNVAGPELPSETGDIFEAIFQSYPDLQFVVDPEGIIVDYSAADEADLYVPPSTFLGKCMWDLLPPDVGDGWRTALGEASSVGRAAVFEYELAVPAGLKSFEGRVRPLNGDRLICIVRDVSEHRSAVANLAASEARYRSLFDEMPVALWEEDYSGAYDLLREKGLPGDPECRDYLHAHPEFVRECVASIRVIRANHTTLEIWRASDTGELNAHFLDTLNEVSMETFVDHLAEMCEGRTRGRVRGQSTTLDGRTIDIDLTWFAPPGHENSYDSVLVSVIDVTDELVRARELRESEERLDMALQGAGLGSWDWNTETHDVVIDARWAAMLGYEPEDFGPGGLRWEDLVHPDDFPSVIEKLQKHVTGETPLYEAEYRISGKDGAWRWIRGRGRAFERDSDGRARRVVGTHLDLTSRRKAEEQAARLASLVEHSGDFISISSLDGTMMFVNSSGRELIGLPGSSELSSLSMTDFYDEAGVELWTERGMPAVIEEGSWSGESSLRNFETRKLTPVLVSAFLLRDAAGHPTAVATVQRDVTEIRHAHEQLARLGAAVEHAAAMVMITDTAGIIQYVNPEFLRRTGFDKDEVIGMTPRIMSSGVHGQPFYSNLWSTIQRGDVWRDRMINRTRDGEVFTVEAEISPIRNDAGATVAYVDVMLDVTRELELEKQLLEVQKMEAVGRLAGGVAHDINNLLQVIVGYGDAVEDGLPEGGRGREAMGHIMGAADRAAQLVTQLLTYSRHQKSHPKVMDLNDRLDVLLKMIRPAVGEDVEIEFRTRPGCTTRVDQGQFEQSIMNLCVNARDAMPDGGKLTIETDVVERNANPAYPWMKPGRFVVVSVTDTGIGMGSDTAKLIFEPFFTTKEIGKGTGLGLATTYGIVRQHGGAIEAESAPGEGATFRIYLPYVDAAAAELETRDSGPVPRGGSESILVVEDDDTVREFVVTTLTGAGYAVTDAASGARALEQLRESATKPDMAVLDVVMPGLKGPELLVLLRERLGDLPAMFLSGYSGDYLGDAIVDMGDVPFVSKPIRRAELLQKVRDLLDGIEG